MAGGADEGAGGGRFHHLAEIEHQDPVGDVLHHTEVVGDEDEREVEVALEIGEQVDDLGLHAHVESRDRLVADHELRLHDEGAGNVDALALAARELVRIAVAMPREEPHPFHRLRDPGPDLVPPQARFMGDERLGDALPAVIRGSRAASGSWKIIWMSRR